ncbi:type II secretion system F family protein [Bifidobacterium sp.]|jgi:pilus assembly protein TadC|uniref:type II secretion system F family protein n=1 Tax=Bifidobacterium sp. TaxID=41200 RepID=UPI0025C05E22|nr:type II secretion system F family protein [Bifidobacterium sp.]MCH4209090.1 type II secretion system F family protein [Bifidobacterium sp.]MCI1224729.1 type II secretion system F family protein [Bifidobacterium sp.]
MGYAFLAGICAFLSCLLACRRPKRGLLDAPVGGKSIRRPVPSNTLVLAMLAVAVRQGSSLPRALQAVGDTVSGGFGVALLSVADALNAGRGWRDAWNNALRAQKHTQHAQTMQTLHDALSEAWVHGSSPVGPLETAIEQEDEAQRAAIEQGASRLSVRLLIPTGLCFLPSFILIGVVPAIASFAA